MIDSRLNNQRALRKGRAAPANKARLCCFDFHDDQPNTMRRRQDRLMSRIFTGAGPVTA